MVMGNSVEGDRIQRLDKLKLNYIDYRHMTKVIFEAKIDAIIVMLYDRRYKVADVLKIGMDETTVNSDGGDTLTKKMFVTVNGVASEKDAMSFAVIAGQFATGNNIFLMEDVFSARSKRMEKCATVTNESMDVAHMMNE